MPGALLKMHNEFAVANTNHTGFLNSRRVNLFVVDEGAIGAGQINHADPR